MRITVEEGYELWLASKEGGTSALDGIALCLFEDYSAGISGYEQRQYLREKRPSVYEELDRVQSFDDFAAIVARYKFEMEV